ncbi:MAG: triple tyrosine motif-containing protein [Ferruginibacter sp.]
MKQLRITLYLLLLLPAWIFAQEDRRVFSFQSLTINDGLSQGMISAIVQDKHGFMWFATKDGLNRYDGYEFTVFRYNAKDSNSVSDNYITDLVMDVKGRLWVITPKGIDLYDEQTESFTRFRNDDHALYKISAPPIQRTWADSNANVFFVFNTGIDKITVNENEKDPQKKYTITHITTPELESAQEIFVNSEGRIFTTHTKTAFIYELINNSWKPVVNVVQFLRLNGITDYDSTDVKRHKFIDENDGKIYFIFGNALLTLDEKSCIPQKAWSLNINPPGDLNRESSCFSFVFKDRPLMIDRHSGHRITEDTKDSINNRMAGNCTTLFTDRSGVQWVGTTGYGIRKLNPGSVMFHHTDVESILSMNRNAQGNIIVRVYKKPVAIYDPNTRKYIETYEEGKAKKYGGEINEFAYPLFTDRRRNMWHADNNSLYKYDPNIEKVFKWNMPFSFPLTGMDRALCITEDGGGYIWIAAVDGLFRFHEADSSWKHYKNDPADDNSLSTTYLFSIEPDYLQPSRYLWVGTNGGGLNRFDIATGKSIHYTTKDGLPNDVVYSVLQDELGNIWMSTNKGLSCFNPQKLKFRNYEVGDGLQSNEFNHNAYCRGPGGYLFFGGINGFNYFRPAELLSNTVQPNVVITALRINNRLVSFNDSSSILTMPVYLTDKIVLPYADNIVSVDFASLDFAYSGKNLYQYRLTGFNNAWIQAGAAHTATYTNLDPGTYTLEIKASNADGVWNELPRTLKIIILPPWYMTWWFRTLVIATIIVLGYIFYRYRLKQALKLQAIRNNIAQDLHDEIGSNLSNISIFSDVAQQDENANTAHTNAMLKKISEYTNVSMESMGDIVWMINARNDRFENIITRMRSHAAEVLEAKGCMLHMNFDEKLNELKLNMTERKNFYLIYKEAINNIAKYADCKNVWIDMRLNHMNVMLRIKDDGKGFDMKQNKQGNGLYNMNKRAATLNGKFSVRSLVGKGTEIELIFAV